MLSLPPSRRSFLTTAGAAALGSAMASTAMRGTPLFADETALAGPQLKGQAEHCIFVWLGGGMAQIDTFDPKRLGDPKTKQPGSYYPSIPTAVPGVELCEHLKLLAPLMDRVTAVRTIHHEVIDEHAAATNRMHTGRPVSGTVVYPSIGSIVAQQRGSLSSDAPAYVLIGYPNITRGPGFLGARHSYLYLTDTQAGPAGLTHPDYVTSLRQSRREALLNSLRKQRQSLEQQATVTGTTRPLADYEAVLETSQKLSGATFQEVFQLDQEAASLRENYGGEFGQRCLLARRLIERGVRFIEVSHNLNFVNGTGWDTHNDGILKQHLLIQEMDRALSALITDLEQRKLLDKTLIVVSTEFGRPADFDAGGGRGHQGQAFTLVLAGGGLKHRGAYGVTDELSRKPVEHPVSVPDLFATMHATLGIDYRQNLFDGDRPVPITDNGRPIAALFG